MKRHDRHPPRRILVVDDDRDAALSLAMLLRVTGHDAHTAFDGDEAVEHAASVQPDVVLMDLRLPRVNGYEACRRMRANPGTHGTLILALTGMSDDCATKCRDAGFDGYLMKPVDYDVLMSRVATLSAGRMEISGTGSGT